MWHTVAPSSSFNEVHHDRGVVAGAFALALLPVDPGVNDAGGQGGAAQGEVEAHALATGKRNRV